MFILLMTLFIILSFLLALFILIQQGKGDMGMGSLGGGGQLLFGGSGGQGFFEKTTWTLGTLFILGALGLTILKKKDAQSSRLSGFAVSQKQNTPTKSLVGLDTKSTDGSEEDYEQASEEDLSNQDA